MSKSLEAVGLSDQGVVRRRNEDAFLVRDLSSRDAGEAWLLAVADGMGGMAGGQTASTETIGCLSEIITGWPEDPAASLRESVVLANDRLRQIVARQPELWGMGTTLVTALIREATAWLGNVGDSRAYLVRHGDIRRITDDHSWVGEQVRAGRLTEAEAAVHPRRNVITRSVGSEERVEPEIFGPLSLEPGDTLLLCSDGLYEVVADAEMADYAVRLPVEKAAAQLIDLANSRGGPDNVTVVMARQNG